MSGLITHLFQNPLAFGITAAILLTAISIHEFAHAFIADKLGDPTPRHQGRVTLNPLAHLDPIGTLMLLFVGFGWGRPVVFDPYNLKNPTRDAAIIALAGPVSNLIIATLVALLMGLLARLLPGLTGLFASIAFLSVFYNVMLAIFNLVPIHPLDGGKILTALLPPQLSIEFDDFFYKNGHFVLLALLIPWAGGVSPISRLISGPIQVVTEGFLTVFTLVSGLAGNVPIF